MESAGAEGAGCGARDVERTAAGGFGRLDFHQLIFGRVGRYPGLPVLEIVVAGFDENGILVGHQNIAG